MSVVSITKQPLLPVVTIEKNDASVYTFNHFTTTYGFHLRGLHTSPPKDNQKGEFEIRLTSSDATNSGANTILSNIKKGNEVIIWVGKSDASKEKVFLGLIETLEIDEEGKDYMDIRISGPDWGSDLLKSRIINGQWVQAKDTDGTTLLSSDTNTTMQQIVLDILTKTSSYPANDVTVETQGLSVSATNVKTPGVQLASFVANYERLDDKLAELDGIGGTIHWVDPDKIFHMERPEEATLARPADILITDDYSNSTALNWEQDKVGLIGRGSSYKSTVENKKSRLYGIGGDLEDIDQESTTTSGSTTCYNQYIGQKFTPTKRFLEGVSLYVKKTGSPLTSSLTLLIIEDDGGNPEGDILRSVRLDERYITTGGDWATWKTQVELNTAKSYWLVLQINPNDDASNHYDWYHDSGSSGTNATSADGADGNWTVNTSDKTYAFRTYITTPLISVMSDPNTVLNTSKHYHEDVIIKTDITLATVLWKLLQGESETVFKEKEILKCKIYAPDTLLVTGQRIKVIKTASGKSIDSTSDGYGDFVLSHIGYDFESAVDQGTGTFWYDAELVRFIPYS